MNQSPLVDLAALPRLRYTDRRHMPQVPAVYFVIDGNRVLYVGMSFRLWSRWASGTHQIGAFLHSFRIDFEVAWLEVAESEACSIRRLERIYLHHFQPPFNSPERCQGIKPSKTVDPNRTRKAMRGWKKRREESQHGT